MNPEYKSDYVSQHDNDVLVLLDPTITEAARRENLARECINRVQKLRKKIGLQTTDDVRMEYRLLDPDTSGMREAIRIHRDIAIEKMRGPLVEAENDDVKGLIAEEETAIDDVRFILRLLKL
jgi:isoleucyl-tRNA synthetase